MKKTLLAMTLMCGSAFAQYPEYGAPSSAYPATAQAPVPDPYSVGGGVAPGACGPGYVWVDGYTDANGYFVNGYCTVPPFVGAYWVAPTFFGGRFVPGYWGHGGIGYGPGFSVRGGYDYGFRGRYRGDGYARGFRAPAPPAANFRSQGAAPSFRSPGGYRGGGSAMRGGGSGHGGRR